MNGIQNKSRYQSDARAAKAHAGIAKISVSVKWDDLPIDVKEQIMRLTHLNWPIFTFVGNHWERAF